MGSGGLSGDFLVLDGVSHKVVILKIVLFCRAWIRRDFSGINVPKDWDGLRASPWWI